MNDPNGLVYFAGEYHLYFQYNPFGDQWGHMSWGHAVSPDLLTWTELPVAIPEREGEMIFSGSIVVDENNVSGLGIGAEPPFLAFYTGFDEQADVQRQCLAYSHDRGRTFHMYADNPLIDLGMAHFRDPKVFRHAASNAWIMVVALAREHKVQIYRSTNLLDWSLAGTFGPAGSTSGQWECPDLMPVPLENDPSQTKWVLKVDVDAAFIGGGSGAQYFIGDFDGFTFAIDPNAAPDGETVDFGPDFYAAVSWANLPPSLPGPVWVGWMSNHQTGRFYPTQPWRGAQSLPRALFLFEETGKLKLGQRPIAAVDALFGQPFEINGTTDTSDVPMEEAFRATFALPATGGVMELISDDMVLLSLTFDVESGLAFRRHAHSNIPDVSFAFESFVPYRPVGDISVDLFFDSCLVDLFICDGQRVFSSCIFPHSANSLKIGLPPGVAATIRHTQSFTNGAES